MKMLFLDDMPERHEKVRRLFIGRDVTHVFSAEEAAQAMKATKYDVVSLDHDLAEEQYSPDYAGGGSDGTMLAKWMAEHLPKDKMPNLVMIHSLNPDGSKRMHKTLQDAGFRAVKKPFTMWN